MIGNYEFNSEDFVALPLFTGTSNSNNLSILLEKWAMFFDKKLGILTVPVSSILLGGDRILISAKDDLIDYYKVIGARIISRHPELIKDRRMLYSCIAEEFILDAYPHVIPRLDNIYLYTFNFALTWVFSIIGQALEDGMDNERFI